MRTNTLTKYILSAIVIVVVSLSALHLVRSNNSINSADAQTATNGNGAGSGTATVPSASADIPNIVDRVNPAVVSIVGDQNVSAIDPLTGQTFSQSRTLGGTGFLVTSNGLIVTNKHVISAQGVNYSVFTTDGKEYPVQVVSQDPVLDIAIIKITGTGFPFLNFANSDQIRIGQTAIAIGNALGEFRNSVSVGVVSGLSRSVTAGDASGQSEQLDELIQTDAAINPGNSGGPLLDASGNIIGVNVAAAQGSENIGFAILANSVKKDVDSVRNTGKIVRAFLGVRYVNVNKVIQQASKLPVDYGALILGGNGSPAIEPDSAASREGLKENDIIISVDNTSLRTRSLSAILRDKSPNDKVKMTVMRDGKQVDINVTLGSI